MGRIGVAQQVGAGVVIGIKEGHKPVRLGQVFLGQLVEVVKDALGGMAAQHLGPQHAAQHGHQQTCRHALAHHIAHHQRPAGLFAAAAQQLGAGGDEVVIVTAHLEGGAAAGGQLNAIDHRTAVRQQLGLDFSTDAELAIEPLMAPHGLEQGLVFQSHGGKVGHQLQVAAMHLAPGKALPIAEDV